MEKTNQNHNWVIYVDPQMINYLLGQHIGYKNFLCLMCPWGNIANITIGRRRFAMELAGARVQRVHKYPLSFFRTQIDFHKIWVIIMQSRGKDSIRIFGQKKNGISDSGTHTQWPTTVGVRNDISLKPFIERKLI